jgi:hypothetical protein
MTKARRNDLIGAGLKTLPSAPAMAVSFPIFDQCANGREPNPGAGTLA